MLRRSFLPFAIAVLLMVLHAAPALAQSVPLPRLEVDFSQAATQPAQIATALKMLGLMTILSLAPAIVICMTSFTRIVIVLSFVRQAIGFQNAPPNQVLVSLALFLTFFVMAPVARDIESQALTPLMSNEISDHEALERAVGPLRDFMLRQTREDDLRLFYEISESERPDRPEDVSLHVLVPAFMISELRTAFMMGFMIFLPFLVIDMAVASILMSMGMVMLPPAMISLPLKVMLFVLVDGWGLVIGSLAQSFT
jgi:flagellar biosynthesis protein FliP